uniref:Variant surface glycoprotein 444 n=1 Tax=Trypanosoma brucei TaxID=5691 RepID=M4T1R0_9TRYP|nr:variant surface glycoprotein 444 [Trypanosoma brucei]
MDKIIVLCALTLRHYIGGAHAAAAEGALNTEAVKNLCDTSKAAKSLPTTLTKRIQMLITRQHQYNLLQRKIAAIQLIDRTNDHKLTVLRTFAQKTLEAISAEIMQLAPEAPAAAAKVAYAAGLIDDFVTIFEASSDTAGTANACLVSGNGDDKKAAVTDLAGCLKSQVGEQTQEHELATLKTADFDFGSKPTLTADKNCMLTKADGTTYVTGTASKIRPARWGGGILTIVHTGGPTTKLTSAKDGMPAHKAAAAASADIDAKLKTTIYPPANSEGDLTSLLKAEPPNQLLADSIKQTLGKTDGPGYNVNLDIVRKTFGFSTTATDIAFIQNLRSYKVPIKTAAGKEAVEIIKLTATQIAEGERAALEQNQKLVAKGHNSKLCESTDKKTAEDICNKIADANECNKKAFCSYNETVAEGEKKCKFNETKAEKSGVPVTQAQTGGGATSTTSDRCTRHKDKANCEKENEGQKPGEKAKCGWIEETCKDSSFLVNRKFALSVVSAAFVALLF